MTAKVPVLEMMERIEQELLAFIRRKMNPYIRLYDEAEVILASVRRSFEMHPGVLPDDPKQLVKVIYGRTWRKLISKQRYIGRGKRNPSRVTSLDGLASGPAGIGYTPADPGWPPEVEAAYREMRDRAEIWWAGLEPRQQAVILLSHLELTDDEIGRRLGSLDLTAEAIGRPPVPVAETVKETRQRVMLAWAPYNEANCRTGRMVRYYREAAEESFRAFFGTDDAAQ